MRRTWSWFPGSMSVGWRQAASWPTTAFSGSTGSVPRVCQKSPAGSKIQKRCRTRCTDPG
jgi:hypothetical protein